MAQYLSYRSNGNTTLKDRIPAALEHFKLRVSKPPIALVVNPRNVVEAVAILKALNLATLDVIGSGGVALSEIWLQQAEPKRKEATKDNTGTTVQ